MSQQYQVVPQVLDAFSMNAQYYRPHLPYNWFVLATEQLDALRRTGGMYRMRQYVSPRQFSTLIDPFQIDKDSVRIEPGSYVWAFSFVSIKPGGGGSRLNFTITMSDHETGEAFVSAPVNGGIANYPTPNFLAAPRLMLGSNGSATIDVTLLNRSAFQQQAQLLIYTAEPCVLVSEAS